MTTRELELLAFVSQVRTCPDACPACKAEAAALLGEPVDRCPDCGHYVLPGQACGCQRYVGEPRNPASAHFHEASKGAA